MRTQLLILMLFGFLNVLFISGASFADRGEHLGGPGASEGVGSPGGATSEASNDERGGPGALDLSFRYEPACSSYNPPGTSNASAPFGAGGTGLNDLACNDDYQPVPPMPDQQAGQVGILGQTTEDPKLVPPKKFNPEGETVVNPDQ